MKQPINKITSHLSQLPFCETFLCLWRRSKLRDGVMPPWFTKVINWTIE